jgi:ammonium transporter Rh
MSASTFTVNITRDSAMTERSASWRDRRCWRRGKFTLVLIFLQCSFIVLFGVFLRYSPVAMGNFPERTVVQITPAVNGDGSGLVPTGMSPASDLNGSMPSTTAAIAGDVPATEIVYAINPDTKAKHDSDTHNHIPDNYALYQDIHVMMFVGFGFLMTFLHRYGLSSVGFNFLLAAFCIQWATLTDGFIRRLGYWTKYQGSYYIWVDITTMINSDFAIASALVSFGAVLGKISPLQLVIMGLFEMAIYNVNCLFVYDLLKVDDPGCSLTVHTFGAYFGLTVSRMIYKKDVAKETHKETSVYHSDIFSMVGTLFLWTLYPSFNAGTAVDEGKIRAIVNTYFSLTGSCVTAFAITALVNKEKFSMVHIQNSTIAGGVGVGTCAQMVIQPWGALLIGSVAGTLSVLGFRFIMPLLRKLNIHDTCGVHNLHGMPGVTAGLGSIIAAGVATDWRYGDSLQKIFVETDRPRNILAGIQAAGLFTSLGMGIVGGIITGIVLLIPIWDQPRGSEHFDDLHFWTSVDEIPEEKILDGNYNLAQSKQSIATTPA